MVERYGHVNHQQIFLDDTGAITSVTLHLHHFIPFLLILYTLSSISNRSLSLSGKLDVHLKNRRFFPDELFPPADLRIPVLRNFGIHNGRRFLHVDIREKSGCKTLEVACPFFVMVHTDGKADGTIIMFGEIWKALTCIDHVTIVA